MQIHDWGGEWGTGTAPPAFQLQSYADKPTPCLLEAYGHLPSSDLVPTRLSDWEVGPSQVGARFPENSTCSEEGRQQNPGPEPVFPTAVPLSSETPKGLPRMK